MARSYRVSAWIAALALPLSAAVSAQSGQGVTTVEWDGVQTEYPPLAMQFWQNQDYDGAEPYFRQVLAARARELGEGDRETLVAANNFGVLLIYAGRAALATEVYERWTPLAMAALGPEDQHALTMLTNQAEALRGAGRLAEALEPSQRSADALAAAFGADDARALSARAGLAALRQTLGQRSEALAVYEALVPALEQQLGAEDPQTQSATGNLGVLYEELGLYERAEPVQRTLLAAQDVAIVGDNPPGYYRTLANLAVLEYRMGRYGEALAGLAEAERGLAAHVRSDHPDLLNIRNTRASIFIGQGRLIEAEPLLIANLGAREAALGAYHPDTISARNNLGSLYRQQGRMEEAEAIYRLVLDQSRAALGETHPDTLSAINNLAGVIGERGSLVSARTMLRRALDASRVAGSGDDPTSLTIANNLAAVLSEAGEYDAALELFAEIAQASARTLGGEHPQTLSARANYAAQLGKMFRYAEAEPILADVLARRIALLGAAHPQTIRTAAELARLRLRMLGREQAALDAARQAMAGLAARHGLAEGGEGIAAEEQVQRETLAIADVPLLLAEAIWAQSSGTPDAAALEEALAALQLASTGAAGRSIAQMAVLRYADAAGDGPGALATQRQELADRYQTTNARLGAAAARADPEGVELAAELRAEQAEIETKLAEVDAGLREQFPEYFALISPATLDGAQLGALFAEGEAGLLIVPGEFGTHLVLIRNGEVHWQRADLNREGLDPLVRHLLWSAGADVDVSLDEYDEWQAESEGEGVQPFPRDTAFALYQRLIAPLMPELAGVERLFVASAGQMSSLPLAILVTDEPQGLDGAPADLRATAWLGDRFAISQLPSLQSLDLLRRLEGTGASGEGMLGFGDPVLEGEAATRGGGGARLAGLALAAEGLLRGLDGKGQPGAVLEKVRALNRLPGTAAELQAIRTSLNLPGEAIFLADRATEANFRAANFADANVLMFATHGLLAGELEGVPEPALILTPPATFSDASNDGMLTASEVAGLRLAAEWVILSACNTAAGDARSDSSSLSGLARAFFHAGAQSLLASYWPVGDEVASKMVVRILEMAETMPRTVALQRAMREIRNNPAGDTDTSTWAHPAAWAPFGLIGDGSH